MPRDRLEDLGREAQRPGRRGRPDAIQGRRARGPRRLLSVALLLLLGAGLALTGSIGLVRLRGFYERIHAPTLGTSLGTGCILLASMLFFSVLQARLVQHEALIGIFTVLTTPVTLMLLARAALYRDRREGSDDVPQPPAPVGVPDGGRGRPSALATGSAVRGEPR
jgi:multicomponent K+:H+ antiporter subunit G